MPFPQRNSRYWGISWYGPDGRQIKRSSKTENWFEAKRIEHEKRAEAAKQRVSLPAHSFNVMMDRYLGDIEDHDHYERSFYAVQRLLEFFDGRGIPNLEQRDYSAYRRHRLAQGAVDSTIDRELRTMSAAVTHARTEWKWPLQPLGIKLKRRDGRIRWITQAEARKLIKAARAGNQNKANYLVNFITLALNTGMRHRELLKLEWSRVDLKQRLIYFCARDHKGRRTSSIPLNPAAVRALKRQRGQHDRWVFVYRKGSTKATGKPSATVYLPEPIKSVRKSFATACRNAGIYDFTVHDLRHTFISWQVQAGHDLAVVQQLARHKSIETTMLYAHLKPGATRLAVNANSFG